MPFTLIRGTFRLTNKTAAGNQTGFEPDGDSMQFKPNNSDLLNRLTRLSQPFKLTSIGSVQLRFEGIDALELHYAPTAGGSSSHQPRPLADDSRDFLTKQLGLNPVEYAAPKNTRVKPPAANDGADGFILSRSLEVHGRPVSFVFGGEPPAKDGQEVMLTTSLLKRSFNFASLLNGFAYPLFYDTLFKDLREAMAGAARTARSKNLGLWAQDLSQKGLKVINQQGLETKGVLLPKLFRRLTDYLAEGNTGLAKFPAFLEAKREQVQDLDPNSPDFTNFTHFDARVSVKGGKVSLTQSPETLVFVSEK